MSNWTRIAVDCFLQGYKLRFSLLPHLNRLNRDFQTHTAHRCNITEATSQMPTTPTFVQNHTDKHEIKKRNNSVKTEYLAISWSLSMTVKQQRVRVVAPLESILQEIRS